MTAKLQKSLERDVFTLDEILDHGGGGDTQWITPNVVRVKNAKADLKRKYKNAYSISMGIVLALHVGVAAAFPRYSPNATKPRVEQKVIQMDEIPETRQIERPPPPPRPAVPIATESDDVPDEVTIESTDLNFDDIALDLPPPPPPGSDGEGMEEEVVEFWAVEEAPVMVREVAPVYPEIARKAGLEGTVYVQFVVGKDGRVRDVVVLRGPEIFRDAAVNAVRAFVFRPAQQNDRPVHVRMSRPIRFRLVGG